MRWHRWILGGLLALLVAFGVGYGIATLVLFPAPGNAGTAVVVPELIGDDRDDAAEALRERGLEIGSVAEWPHAEETVGTVLAQDPIAGQRLESGSAVDLAVSIGRRTVRVPDLAGLSVDAARTLATRLGFEIEVRETVAPGPGGRVLRVRPAAGTRTEVPAPLLIVASVAPEPALDTTIGPADSLPSADLQAPRGDPAGADPADRTEDRPGAAPVDTAVSTSDTDNRPPTGIR